MSFTEDQLQKIFTILVEECGADPAECDCFVRAISRGCREYRCCWALGFGGKFWPDRGRVSYYPEDHTAKIGAICEKTNNRLQELIKTFKKEIDGDN